MDFSHNPASRSVNQSIDLPMNYPKLAVAALTFVSILASANAEVRLPAIFADHMVIQRGVPVHVWGLAKPGEEVRLAFRDVSRAVTADRLGRWEVYFPAGAKGGPFVLQVAGANQLSFSDILVGDLWVASGQSNMEFHTADVSNAQQVLAEANLPNVRLFQVKKTSSQFAEADVSARTWTPATGESVAAFTAVGFLFAREISSEQQAPVGIIEADWGGTTAEAWTSLGALGADSSLMPVFGAFAKLAEAENTFKMEKQSEDDQIAEAKANGKPPPQFPFNMWDVDLRSWIPSGLYNGMIAPLTPFPIRGVIWYQGESNANAERAPTYNRLFETLIRDWRSRWQVGDFPFLFVQLANFKTGPDSKWPDLREAQRRTLELKNTGMAVTIDIGNPDDIHPKDKQDVAHRLALAARFIAYGESLEYSGPVVHLVSVDGSSLRVSFTHSGGLAAKGAQQLTGFEIAGADHKFLPATATIDQDSVLLSNPAIASPLYARYGWDSSPECNLYNEAGLPASPFTTEP
jgi:sialate O-acetylesterase